MKGFSVIGALLALFVVSCAATEARDDPATGHGPPAGSVPSGEGVCADQCPKSCDSDSQCDTNDGELCCDYRGFGKACAPAAACPRFCADDTECNTQAGEACLRRTLTSPEKTCMKPQEAVQTCQSDAECASGDECCTIYGEPVCLPPSLCPKACSQSSECATGKGEICCTTLALVDSTLGAAGLCIDPAMVSCPTPCSSSNECNTGQGELCCDGICSTSCPKACTSSNECPGQLCCTTPAIQSPWLAGERQPGYPVTPAQDTCTAALKSNGICDEPNPCPPGTDAYDCSCPWTHDGICDEPQGTDVCPAGSDLEDCSLECASCNDWLYGGAPYEALCPAAEKTAEQLWYCVCSDAGCLEDCADSWCSSDYVTNSCDECVLSTCYAEVDACDQG
jgi:hypothetical protein